MISSKATSMVENALTPIINSGKRIDRIKLMVSRSAAIAKLCEINTKYGPLSIVPGEYIPKGYSYLIEQPLSRGGLSFVWVSKGARE